MNRLLAIYQCKRIWKDIEASGLNKFRFLETSAGSKWCRKSYINNCPLCEYVKPSYSGNVGCIEKCPLMKQYGEDCNELGYHYDNPCHFIIKVRELKY